MDKVVSMAKKVSKGDSSILIQGESGTGKELLAHSIHNLSRRKDGPFVTIDCSAIPKDLVESELFGYVEGHLLVLEEEEDLESLKWLMGVLFFR